MRVDEPHPGLVLSGLPQVRTAFRRFPTTPERWLSGRKRRFAKPLDWETGLGGSNPPLSAEVPSVTARSRPKPTAARLCDSLAFSLVPLLRPFIASAS